MVNFFILSGSESPRIVSSVDVAVSYLQGYYLSPYPRETNVFLGLDEQRSRCYHGLSPKEYAGSEFQGEFPLLEGSTFRGDIALLYRSAG